MIRPPEDELDASSGTWACRGADAWDMAVACERGDLAEIARLLDGAPDLVRAEYWYTQPLHYAVREGHAEAVRLLLERGADPTHVRYGGDDLVVMAEDRGYAAVAALLREARARAFGSAPVRHAIHPASARGDIAAVTQMLDAEPELVGLPDPDGYTPLHHAVAAGSLELMGLLLDRGAAVDAVAGGSGTYAGSQFRPIHAALWKSSFWVNERKNWSAVGFLLARGAEYSATIAAALGDVGRLERRLAEDSDCLDRAESNGRRPLSTAVQFGHREVAKRLLECGADPNLPEGHYAPRGTALYFAARMKDRELTRLLLEHGADPSGGIDSCGNIWHVSDAETRLLLYRYGLQMPEFDLENIDALTIWAEKDPVGLGRSGCGGVFAMVVKNEWSGAEHPMSNERKHELLMLLLGKGVRVPAVVTGCRTYLWHKPRFARILLEHGMDPNLPNWMHVTPLHDLCSRSGKGEAHPHRVELAQLFLEFGADINARDDDYRSTPLAWAARSGLNDMVELLLQRGAALTLPDDEPWAAPLAWAMRRGHGEVEATLRAAGAR